jgi:hypothetical protein
MELSLHQHQSSCNGKSQGGPGSCLLSKGAYRWCSAILCAELMPTARQPIQAKINAVYPLYLGR